MWLCSAVDGSSDDNGETYRVTYEFQRAPLIYPLTEDGTPILAEGDIGPTLGWKGIIQLEHPDLALSTIVSPHLSPGLGIKAVELYETVEFRNIEGINFD